MQIDFSDYFVIIFSKPSLKLKMTPDQYKKKDKVRVSICYHCSKSENPKKPFFKKKNKRKKNCPKK